MLFPFWERVNGWPCLWRGDARLGNDWKYRVGDWRLICNIQDECSVVRCCAAANVAPCIADIRVGKRQDLTLWTSRLR